jgi:Mlc titration factor MtfA (ptsG expression regulator)
LKQVLCDLKEPGFRAADIPAATVEKHLPLHVQYACRHWIEHLAQLDASQRAQAGLEDNGRIHRFIQSKLLFWIEALSVMKQLPLSIALINRLLVLANVSLSFWMQITC